MDTTKTLELFLQLSEDPLYWNCLYMKMKPYWWKDFSSKLNVSLYQHLTKIDICCYLFYLFISPSNCTEWELAMVDCVMGAIWNNPVSAESANIRPLSPGLLGDHSPNIHTLLTPPWPMMCWWPPLRSEVKCPGTGWKPHSSVMFLAFWTTRQLTVRVSLCIHAAFLAENEPINHPPL